MKTLSILIGLFCLLNIFSQQPPNIETIKKENAKLKEQVQSLKTDTSVLREKLKICELYNKPNSFSISNDGKIEFKFVSCTYNIKTKKARINFILINPLSDKYISFASSEAYDDLGNQYESVAFQKEKMDYSGGFTIVSDTPVKGFIEYNDVLPGVDFFKLIKVSYYLTDLGSFNIEIRNFKIAK